MKIVELALTVLDDSEDCLDPGFDSNTWHLQFPVADEEMVREFVHELMASATDLMMAGEYDVQRMSKYQEESCSEYPDVCCSESGPGFDCQYSDSVQPKSLHEADERG